MSKARVMKIPKSNASAKVQRGEVACSWWMTREGARKMASDEQRRKLVTVGMKMNKERDGGETRQRRKAGAQIGVIH